MSTSPADSSFPDWVFTNIDAAFKVGMTVPEIEKLLVAKGLSPTAATAAVNEFLEGRLRNLQATTQYAKQSLMIHWLASIAVCLLCFVLAYAYGGGVSVSRTFVWLILPVGCIWGAENLEQNFPPAIIRWTAWVVVILILGYRIVLLSLVS